MNNIDKLVDLEKKIQYKFQDFGLLEMAMRHSSYANEHHMERLECNERLEFLGDAVLEVVSSEFLYKTFPRLPEGEMTKKRASLVCEPALAFCAVRLTLAAFCSLERARRQPAAVTAIPSFRMLWRQRSVRFSWTAALNRQKRSF